MSVDLSVPGGSQVPLRRKSSSIRKSISEKNLSQLEMRDSFVGEGQKSRRSFNRKVTIFKNEDNEETLLPACEQNKLPLPNTSDDESIHDDDDCQIKLIRNFKLDSDDEQEKTDNSSLSMFEIQRKLYVEECRRFGIVPVRALAEINENTKHLDVSHFNLGPKGAMALSIPLHLNSMILSLNMENNDIGPYGCQSIAEVLWGNSSIEDVNLSRNNIGSHGLGCMCRIFKNNVSVSKLNLSGNAFGDTNTHLLVFLLQHPFLKELNLSQNEFEYQTAKLIGEQLSSNEMLEILNISWNHFRHRGAEAIAKGLKDNTGLKKLDVSYNGFGSEGVVAMSAALTSNQNLQELDLSHNRIADECITQLCSGLTKNGTLLHLKIMRTHNLMLGILTTKGRFDGSPTGTMTLSQSGDGSNGNEGLTPHSPELWKLILTMDVVLNHTLDKIGGNPMTTFAANALVTTISKSSSCALVSLDLQDVFVDQTFLDLVKEIKQTKSFFVTHGSIWELELITSKLMEASQQPKVVLAGSDVLGGDKPQEKQVLESADQAETSQKKTYPVNAEEEGGGVLESETPPEKNEEEETKVNASQLQMDAAGELNAT